MSNFFYCVGGFRTPDNRGNSDPTSTLFVKNLSYGVTEDRLQSTFAGSVAARIATDRETGKPRGYVITVLNEYKFNVFVFHFRFGYVEFSSVADAQKAMKKFANKELDGRTMFLDFAAERGSGGGGQSGGRGRGRGGSGGRGGFGGRGGGRGRGWL